MKCGLELALTITALLKFIMEEVIATKSTFGLLGYLKK
jgi:hypothetical protein